MASADNLLLKRWATSGIFWVGAARRAVGARAKSIETEVVKIMLIDGI